MEILIDQPKGTASEEVHKLRMLYDKTEGTVRSLKGMGIDANSYSTFITPVIMSQFPQDLCIIISRKMDGDWNLDQLVEMMGEEISLQETCSLVPVGGNTTSPGIKEKSMRSTKLCVNATYQSNTTTLMVNNEGFRGSGFWKDVPNCLFCDRKHFSASCSKVTDPNNIKSILRERH